MSLTNAKLKKPNSRGFTLVELIVSVSLSAIIFAAILGGFTFLGRNLARLVNARDQDAKSARTFYRLGQDINGAMNVDNIATDRALKLTVEGLGKVQYIYDEQALTFTRTAPTASAPNTLETIVLLTDLTALTFKYYNQAGTLLDLSDGEDVDLTKSGIQSIKEIELSFASAVGNSTSGTRSPYNGKSPRFVLRNRPLLQ